MQTQTFNIAMPVDLLQKVDRVAKKEYKNRSELIREALMEERKAKKVKIVLDTNILISALEGSCDYIITGDKKLLDLKIFRGIKILKADEFVSLTTLAL